MIKKLHNGTLKTVTNIRVPKKWKRFEYLESTGTLWIDTGLIGTSNMRIELTFMSGSTVDRMFGAGPPGDNAIYLMANYDGASTLGIRYFGIATNIPYTINTKCHIIITNSELIKDGVQQITLNKTGSTVNTLTLFMYNSSPISTNTKIYEYKVYDGPTLIQHFIPCEYNGQYGMWDLVENKFYGNKGTGTFKVGPEIPNYDEIEYIKRPNHLLPNGIELYDYIENQTTSYIDIGLTTKNTYEYNIKALYTTSFANQGVAYPALIGAADNDKNRLTIRAISGKIQGVFRETSYGSSAPDTNIHTYKLNKNSFIIDSTVTAINDNTVFNSTNTIHIFHENNATPTQRYSKARIYYVLIKEGTTLIRNFLPCTYFGEPGMWDTVTNKFYGNSGTGLFKLGNKIELKEYEYLLSDGNQYINSGILLNEGFKIQSKFIPLKMGNSAMIWGSYVAGNRYDLQFTFGFWAQRSNTAIYRGTVDKTNANDLVGNIYEVLDTLTDIIINNKSYSNKTIPKFRQNDYNLYIFAGRSDNYRAKAKLFYFKYYDNNTLVRDYYPCLYNGEYGLWDRVELKFYPNAGTGSFTVGPRIDGNVNIYEKKNALVRTSTAYINTGVVANNNTKLVAEIQYTTLANNGRFGSYGSDGRFYFGTMNNQWAAAYGSEGSYNHSLGAADTNKHLFELNAEGFFIDGIKKYTSSPKNFTSKIELNCQVLQNGTGSYKIYWFKIYKDNILVRDFIPATLGGKPGLYDKVEHKMYYNANSTGQFTVE